MPEPRYQEWIPIRSPEIVRIIKGGISEWHKTTMAEPFFDLPEMPDNDWMAVRQWVSGLMLHECVAVDPDIRGGYPVLRGTRIGIAQILIEISDAECILEIAEEYDIDHTNIRKLIEGIAIRFDQSFAK